MMRSLVSGTLLLGVALGASCNRVEEPEPTHRALPTPESNPAPEPAPQAKPEACVVPMPEVAAPVAKPAEKCPADPDAPGPTLARGSVTFVDAPGAPRVDVELARNDSDRSRGLMYRTKMDQDKGMLFSWGDEEVRSFWMKNTCLPLDMLFIARDGTIAGVLEQVPTLNEASRRVPCPAAHVLELNAGWVREHGVKPGQKVDIKS